MEVPMVNARAPNVQLHTKLGSKHYIFNRSEQELALRRGLVIAGFGRGGFKVLDNENEVDSSKHLLYALKGMDDEVPNASCCNHLYFVLFQKCLLVQNKH